MTLQWERFQSALLSCKTAAIQCDGCREYIPCIPVCNICGNEDQWDENGECSDTCVEGCSCPDGMYYFDDECVEECPATTPTISTPFVTTPPPWLTTTPQFPTTTPFYNICKYLSEHVLSPTCK